MQFPTGGESPRAAGLTRRNSVTDSTVWRGEVWVFYIFRFFPQNMKTGKEGRMQKTSKIRLDWMLKTGLLAAIAFVLMYIEIPIPIVPPWLKLDISDLPTLLAGFSLGPIFGLVVNTVKVVLFFIFKNSGTGGVGELANFIMGLCLVLPAAFIYRKKKTKKGALIGAGIGILAMTVASGLLNYYMLIPAYALLMPIEAIINACTAIHPAMNTVAAYVFMAAMPFTLAKGLLDAIILFFIYKRISPILHRQKIEK